MSLALTHLHDAVIAQFEADGTHVPNLFGWRKPATKLTTGTRISWYPGDPSGNVGGLLPPKQPGRNPRPLATLDEQFTVEIQANDSSKPNDERAQYVAARLLYDAWYRAAYLAARGTFRVVSSKWLIDNKERRYGACLQVVCAIDSMIPDEAHAVAPADTGALIDVEELDLTETVEIPDSSL